MIDNVSIKQRIEQFDFKHGVDDAVKSLDGTMWLFPDGARRETNILGSLQEPPDPDNYFFHGQRQPRELGELVILERQHDYHSTWLQHLTNEFRNRKERMLGGHYSDEDMAELNKLQKTIHICTHQLSMVEAEIQERSPRDHAREARAEQEQKRQERIAAVKSINI